MTTSAIYLMQHFLNNCKNFLHNVTFHLSYTVLVSQNCVHWNLIVFNRTQIGSTGNVISLTGVMWQFSNHGMGKLSQTLVNIIMCKRTRSRATSSWNRSQKGVVPAGWYDQTHQACSRSPFLSGCYKIIWHCFLRLKCKLRSLKN